MIVGTGASTGEIIVARVEHGEDLLEALQKLCVDNHIRNGVILPIVSEIWQEWE